MADKIEKKLTFDEALFNLLEEVEQLKIVKDAENPHFKSSYASLGNILNILMPIIRKHKFMHKFKTFTDHEHGSVGMTMTITYMPTGEKDEITMEQAGIIGEIQKQGSFHTYARRYLPIAFYNLEVEDDDGNAASAPSPAPATGVNREDVQLMTRALEIQPTNTFFKEVAAKLKQHGKLTDRQRAAVKKTVDKADIDQDQGTIDVDDIPDFNI
jgi:hypothetical protein